MILTPLHDLTDQIAALCERHQVHRLEVLGSLTRIGRLDAADDIDMIVAFGPLPDEHRFDRCFKFNERLDVLLGKPVDLLEASAIRNRAFLKSIESDRTDVYAK